jgi:hypothetical protein
MLRRVVLTRTAVSEKRISSMIKMTRIGKLGRPLAARRFVPSKRLSLQEPLGLSWQKTAFFIVTAVKTSNNTKHKFRIWEIWKMKYLDDNWWNKCNMFKFLFYLNKYGKSLPKHEYQSLQWWHLSKLTWSQGMMYPSFRKFEHPTEQKRHCGSTTIHTHTHIYIYIYIYL